MHNAEKNNLNITYKMRASDIAVTNRERDTQATGDSPMKISQQCSVKVKKANGMLVIIRKRSLKK